MIKEEFFDVLCDIEETYIEEAHKKNGGAWNVVRIKGTAVAACVTLVIVAGVLTVKYLPPSTDHNAHTEEATDGVNYMVADLQTEITEEQTEAQGKEAIKKEETSVEDAGIEVVSGAGDVEDVSEAGSADAPADVNGAYHEAIVSNDLTKDSAEIFGGSYLDDSGNFVIVLTEDTPENRAAICKELSRSESATIFASGAYSLEYLTELQAKISNAMINKEIPFVVSSGVHETTNNIVVTVTTTDEAELKKIYELDTIGGAIQVEYCTDAPTKDLDIAIKTE